MELGLRDKVAAVTGARKGIGYAIARALAREGARVSICSRDREELVKAAERLRKETGAQVTAVQADVSKVPDQKRFVAETLKAHGRIDILVNNAGSGHVGDLLAVSDEVWEHHLNLKLMGYIRLTREVIPHMQKQGGGTIILIAGGYGKEPDGYAVVPGVINAGLLNFTRSAASRFAADRIRVVGINPAVTETDLAEEMAEQVARSMGTTREKVKELTLRSFPLGRVGRPEDVANAVIFLASETAGFITGSSLAVDGGVSRGL